VGAYAYSQGMEQAVAAGWLCSWEDLEQWISGLLRHSLANMEVPFFKRFYETWDNRDPHRLNELIQWYLAGRGTSELLAEERHMGQALQRLLDQLEVFPADLAKTVTLSFLAFFQVLHGRGKYRSPMDVKAFCGPKTKSRRPSS
jgi:urease accessory protein UreF